DIDAAHAKSAMNMEFSSFILSDGLNVYTDDFTTFGMWPEVPFFTALLSGGSDALSTDLMTLGGYSLGDRAFSGEEPFTSVRFWASNPVRLKIMGLEFSGSSITFHFGAAITHNIEPAGLLGFLFRPSMNALFAYGTRSYQGYAVISGATSVADY